MRITAIAFPVLRLQYRIARAPLELFNKHFVSRINSKAPARLPYERSVGTLDITVGNVLRDPKLRLRGTTLAERSAVLAHAAALDAAAACRKKQADDELYPKSDQEAAAKDQAHAAKRREVQHTRTTAAQRKREASESSAERTAASEDRIDAAADKKTVSGQPVKNAELRRIKAVDNSATTVFAAKLDDDGKSRSESVSEHVHADRVQDLANAEKQKRKDTSVAGRS